MNQRFLKPAAAGAAVCCAVWSLLSAFPAELTAYADSGRCGPNTQWSYDGTTLTLSGTGAVTTVTWNLCRDSLTEIIIEDGVTALPGSAFTNCESLTSVRFGKDLTAIAPYCFQECMKLTKITIPATIQKINS